MAPYLKCNKNYGETLSFTQLFSSCRSWSAAPPSSAARKTRAPSFADRRSQTTENGVNGKVSPKFRLHYYYGWLRLPRIAARVLAFYTCSRVPAPADRCADLPGYRVLSMSDSTRPGTPGSTGAARHCAAPVVAYRRDKTVGAHQPKFSGLNTFKVGSTRYLCTSPAFVPTHRRACYQSRRKARYWARGSRLPRRDSHPLEHAALPGRTVPYYPGMTSSQSTMLNQVALFTVRKVVLTSP